MDALALLKMFETERAAYRKVMRRRLSAHARECLRDARAWRDDLAREAAALRALGAPLEEEERKLDLLRNAFAANESVIDSSPEVALDLLAKQGRRLFGIGRAILQHRAAEIGGR